MTLPTLAHVFALRRLVKTPSTSPTPTVLEAELTAAGLLTWHGGAGKVADGWGPTKPASTVVTPAGHWALSFYALGRQRLESDAMAEAVGKAKATTKPKRGRS